MVFFWYDTTFEREEGADEGGAYVLETGAFEQNISESGKNFFTKETEHLV